MHSRGSRVKAEARVRAVRAQQGRNGSGARVGERGEERGSGDPRHETPATSPPRHERALAGLSPAGRTCAAIDSHRLPPSATTPPTRRHPLMRLFV